MLASNMTDEIATAMSGWTATQGYWAWAVALAGSFYATTVFLFRHVSPDSRDTLALWLMGTVEDRWSRQFCLLFDRAFGERHWSVRCFLRSSIASVLAVMALYVLFGPIFGFLEYRTEDRMELWKVLLVGVAINIVPDYLSLLETRWLLNQMDRSRSVIWQIAVLAVDLIVTAAIIWGGISLFRLTTGEQPLSVVETLAFFSVFSIFFYSTFFTSVWSWVYCLSSWFLRLFTRTPLGRILNVEKEPASQLALVGAGVILVVALILAPVVEPESRADDGAFSGNRFDQWLCRKFPQDACDHVLRALPQSDEVRFAFFAQICRGEALDFCLEEALRRFSGNDAGAAALLEKTCSGGKALACAYLGWMYAEGRGVAQDYGQAVNFYRRGCEGGVANGCSGLGWMYAEGRGVAKDYGQAHALYRRACGGGDLTACVSLGVMYQYGHSVVQDDGQAVTFYLQGCQGGIATGCTRIGWMYAEGRGVAQEYGQAITFYRRACGGGDLTACVSLGSMYSQGRGVAKDDGQAFALYRQGCQGGIATGCTFLGTMYEEGRGVAQDDGQAVTFYRRGCDSSELVACVRLGTMYFRGRSVAQDDGQAVKLYRRGCQGGIATGCTNLGVMYQYGRGVAQDDGQAVTFYRRGCALGHSAACDMAEDADGQSQ